MGPRPASAPIPGPVVLRAVVIWFAILVLATLNGALREFVLAPRIGDLLARAISPVMLCGLIVLVTWLAIRWIGPGSPREALAIGVLWVGLTLLFEFGEGHYVSHKPWAELAAEYNVLRGRLWVLVPVVAFFAPLWAGRARHLWSPRGP